MRKVLALSLPVLAVIAMLGVVVSGQIKKGKTRPLTTKQLMGGLVKPDCAALGADLKKDPADDKAWAALATQGPSVFARTATGCVRGFDRR